MTPFSLLTAVKTVQHKADPDGLYVEDVLATFGSRSDAFLILFFSIPFVQPIPLLGLSTPFGLAIMTLGIFLSLNKRPWLPQRILRKHIRPKLVASCCNTLIKILEKTEKWVRPRYGNLVSAKFTRVINGILISIFAVLLALPLPIPFSNSIPAYFLILNAISWLEGDGRLLIVSYILAIAGFFFFFSVGLGAVEVWDWINIKF